MSIKQSYAVFGLGRYGRAVAKELVESGAEVLAVDIDEDIVNEAIAELTIPPSIIGWPVRAGNASKNLVDPNDSLNGCKS